MEARSWLNTGPGAWRNVLSCVSKKSLAMISILAPVSVNYYLRTLLAELMHPGGLMATTLQVIMIQEGTSKSSQLQVGSATYRLIL